MPLATQGILDNLSLANEQSTVLFPYLRELYINETPLVTRLPRKPAEGATYNIISYDTRPRAYTLNAAFTASAADVDITLIDATTLMVGDVLEVLDTAGTALERVEVTEIVSGTAVNVRRERESTVAIANTAAGSAGSKVVTLIGNSRTGKEINQDGYRAIRTATPQYVQTFQVPVQVGGLANATANTRLPEGFSDVFSMEQKIAINTMMLDEEYTSYYGMGEARVATNDRAKQKGLRKQIQGYKSGANVLLTAGPSYTFLKFVADTVEKIVAAGGDPDSCVCSTDFLTGLLTWGFAKAQIVSPRESALGVPIKEITVPFTSGSITFIPSYQMRAGTACVMTSGDACVREIRSEQWKPRGSRGDAHEGDYLSDVCIEAGHAGYHAWVEGIQSFA